MTPPHPPPPPPRPPPIFSKSFCLAFPYRDPNGFGPVSLRVNIVPPRSNSAAELTFVLNTRARASQSARFCACHVRFQDQIWKLRHHTSWRHARKAYRIMYVCVYVCMYVCVYVCMYVCMYWCMTTSMYCLYVGFDYTYIHRHKRTGTGD